MRPSTLLLTTALVVCGAAAASAQTSISAEAGLLRWGALKQEVTHYARLGGQGSDMYTALSLDFRLGGRWWLGGRFLWSDTELNVWECGEPCEESWFYNPQPFHQLGRLDYSIAARWRQIALTASYRPADQLQFHFGPGLVTLSCEYRICGSSPMGNIYVDLGTQVFWNVTPQGAIGLGVTASPIIHRDSHWTVIAELTGAKERGSDARVLDNENVFVVPVTLSIVLRLRLGAAEGDPASP